MNTPFHLMILKAFSAQRNTIRPRMAGLGLSPGQPKILNILTMRGECLQKDLAEACDIEPATVSKLLNNMEENHLITRGTVPGNKRAERFLSLQKEAGFRRRSPSPAPKWREKPWKTSRKKSGEALNLISAECITI